MDAFTVSISCGCANAGISWRKSLLIAAFFGGFQFLMPIAGWLAGDLLSSFIASCSHFIAAGLLAIIGGKMIYESITSEEGCREPDSYFKIGSLLLLSLATSIDAFAAGFAFHHIDSGIFFPASVTGIITFIMSTAGAHAGSKIGIYAGRHAETAGGAVLIIIAVVVMLNS